jgi:hypothetical protein
MPSARRFAIRPRHAARHHGRILAEASFEAAAVAFAEDFAPAPDGDAELAVLVLDLDTGMEHCFRIDLETGETASCA